MVIKYSSDFWHPVPDPSDNLVYNQTKRYCQIEKDNLPPQLRQIIENIYDQKRDEYRTIKEFHYYTMLVVGIYPDLYFLPIGNNGVTTYTDYLICKEVYSSKTLYKKPVKYLKDLGIYSSKLEEEKRPFYADRYKHWDCHPYKWEWKYIGDTYKSIYGHIAYPKLLDELGFEFDTEKECFKLCNVYTLFDQLQAPLFVTDLGFWDYLCNPTLSQIKVNLGISWEWGNENGKQVQVRHRTNFTQLSLPPKFMYSFWDIPERVAEFLTKAKEVEPKPLSDEEKIRAYGFSTITSFRGKQTRPKEDKK
jgi:hypothetical protein